MRRQATRRHECGICHDSGLRPRGGGPCECDAGKTLLQRCNGSSLQAFASQCSLTPETSTLKPHGKEPAAATDDKKGKAKG